MKEILAFCESQLEWVVGVVERLVRVESPTTDKPAVDRCGAELQRALAGLGGRVERLPRSSSGDHLRAEFGSGADQVLLLGHFDTVWPVGQLTRMPFKREDVRLYGPGVFDMKAGLGIGLLALRTLSEVGPRPAHRVVMLCTGDEETGSDSSRATIEAEALKSEAVLVLEPSLPGGVVKTTRKGCGQFELVIHGIAAHAGVEPKRGASAIHEMARQILAIERLAEPDRGITVNVGTIAGGTRTNVIAEHARASIDVRIARAEDAGRVEAGLRSLRPEIPGTMLSVSGRVDRPPFERTAAVARMYEMARQIASEFGVDLNEGGTGGGSDGNFTAALGVPTLDGLGAVGGGAHALDEWVDLSSLAWRAALVAGLILRIGAR
jgi:glutamate carboxypeptidase